MSLGGKIQEMRKKRGYTQEQLSIRSGLSRFSIINYENNRREPRASDLEKIATALDTTPAHLMGWNREPDELDKAVLDTYPNFIPGQGYLPTNENTAANQTDEQQPQENEEIHYIARKMKTLPQEEKEMLMRMIKAAFADDEDE